LFFCFYSRTFFFPERIDKHLPCCISTLAAPCCCWEETCLPEVQLNVYTSRIY
jgi:hypothetical protein